MPKKQIQTLTQNYFFTEEDVLGKLRTSTIAYNIFQKLDPIRQTEFINFCMGKSNSLICYDAFFKTLFHPDMHPGRLSEFLSALLKESVEVVAALSNEGIHLADRGTFVIMDITVRLANGEIVNVEIQKVGHRFPEKRLDCYSADLILREYNRLREIHRDKFSYSMMPSIISIVLFEDSPKIFRHNKAWYIHCAQMKTDTDIPLNSILKHIYISLDNFSETMQYKDISSDIEAWLTLFTSHDLTKIEYLLTHFEGFDEIYRELFQMRQKPEELIYMYQNIFLETDLYEESLVLDDMREEIKEKRMEIQEQDQKIQEQKRELQNQKRELQNQKNEIQNQKNEIQNQQYELESQQQQLQRKDAEIQRMLSFMEEHGLKYK
ncbi:MAG: PD-(D/E)XK nuclease family transposase [Acetatifactor sp.]|nr:PD-(D/E)XK nuclease family transposase [Acetatifactor sp.]